MGEMRFDGGGDEGEGVATLLAAGFDHRQHRLDETAAGGALRSERQLPPDHRMTQRTLARVVRRFDPFVLQKRPQPLAMLVQLPTRAPQRRDCRFCMPRSSKRSTLRRTGPIRRTNAARRNLAGAIVGPMLEQLARGRCASRSQAISIADCPCRSSPENRVSNAPSTIAGAHTASTSSPDRR